MTTLRYAARSVLLAGFAGPVVPSWLSRELELGLGGVCLYGNNVAPGHDLADLARSVRALAPSAVLAIDEEGGDVTRLHTTTGSPYAGPAVLGRLDSLSVTTAVAAGLGAELAAAGIWLDLAPCADVNSDPLNPVIGTRSFGTDPALVARHVGAFVRGLTSSGVAASVKHFPGHGDTRSDSHHAVPTVRATADVVRRRELVPFAAAVSAGAATVMTSHVVLEALDPQHPATFSPVVLGEVLRGELGFEGVVVTDALDMAGALLSSGSTGAATTGAGTTRSGIPGAAVRALAAGADLLCLGPETTAPETTTAGDELIAEVVAAVVAAVEDGWLPADRLHDAADRVARLRAEWTGATPTRGGSADATSPEHLPPRAAASLVRAAREASRDAAAAVLTGVPWLPDAPVIHLDSSSNPAVGHTVWGLPGAARDSGHSAGDSRLAPDELASTPAPTGSVVLAVRGATRDERVWRWIQHTLATNPQAWLAELGWPDPRLDGLAARRDGADRVIRSYGASGASTHALARALGRTL